TAGNRPAHSACGVKTGVAADSTTAAPDTDTAVRSVAPGSGVAVQGAALKPKPALVVDRSAQPGASAGTAALCRTSGAAQLSPATQRDLAQRQVSRPGRVVTGRRAVACRIGADEEETQPRGSLRDLEDDATAFDQDGAGHRRQRVGSVPVVVGPVGNIAVPALVGVIRSGIEGERLA